MRSRVTLPVYLAMALCLALGLSLSASAHEDHECPADLPDFPVIDGHLSHTDIVDGAYTFDAIFSAGSDLFAANFNRCDGRGRPATTGAGDARDPVDQPDFLRTSAPDASSCAGCHNQPRAGGGGDFVANVFVLAQAADPVIDSVSSEFSNERNTLGMFGAGAIEMLAREMTRELHALRDQAIADAQANGESTNVALIAKGVHFGRLTARPNGELDMEDVFGVDHDLIIKPFHQAGVVVSIREFTVNAMNHHHGMQAEERFDLNPDKGVDFDQDGVASELTVGDITATTIFQAALGVPGRVMPSDPTALAMVENGQTQFSAIGCAGCHVPEMTLESVFYSEPNPFNPAGTFSDVSQSYTFDMTTIGEGPLLEPASDRGAIVRAYTDLMRHNLCDPADMVDAIRYYCNEQLAQNRPDQNSLPGAEFFLTRKLWDVGNSAPYGHRGDLSTIAEAILMHGGEARASRDAFTALTVEDQRAIVAFLNTLQILPAGSERMIWD